MREALFKAVLVAACLFFLSSATLALAQNAHGGSRNQTSQSSRAADKNKSARAQQKATAQKATTQKATAPKATNKRDSRLATRAQRTQKNAAPKANSTPSKQAAKKVPSATARTAVAPNRQGESSGPRSEYRLGAGDAIRVMVYQNPDLTVEARVSEGGSISFPLIGPVVVGKLSLSQAEQRIASELRTRKMLKAPHVNIVLLQVRGSQVSVLGEVHRPGRFALETVNVRVSDMLAAAGGVTPTGDDLLTLSGTRNGQPFRKIIDVPALFARARSADDVLLEGGDTLYVNKAPVFYIYGEAQRPGHYRIERGMTVMQALALGGGPTPRGSPDRLRLTRKQSDGLVVQTAPQLTDRVQPGDVLFVQESIF